ncbi:MAG: hypothetical protein KDI74_08435 [Gammaproteobacteria bacterium]|nr:hypothetical protein [Gammaproteobacteria bacterium]
MKSFRRFKYGALVLLTVLAWTSTLAARDADVPRRLFEAQGTMRYLDLPANIVQIDDKRYRLAPNMKWYGVDTEQSLIRQLLAAVNERIAYVVDSEQSSPTVNAIWILPSEGR